MLELNMLSISLRAHDLAIKRLSNSNFPSNDAFIEQYLKTYNEIFKQLHTEALASTYGY